MVSKHKECGAYCYDIVQPLLQYADTVRWMKQEYVEQRDKYQQQEIKIKNVEGQCSQQSEVLTKITMSYCLLAKILVARIKDLEKSQVNLKSKEKLEKTVATDCRLFNYLKEIYTIHVPGLYPFPLPCEVKPN